MRFLFACVTSLVFGAALVLAQTANYSGYAYADCTPANTPATRLILVQGSVPSGIPERAPRPSIDILVYSADAAVGSPITISPEPAAGANAIARSCPVVGSCAAAASGTVSIARDASGALTGEFRAQWGSTPARQGKFSVEWRENASACK